MRIDPYRPSEPSERESSPAKINRHITTADPFLAVGFLCLAFAAGTVQFVMIGLLGIALFCLALVLLLIAGVIARGDTQRHWITKIAGYALFVPAVLALITTSTYATSLMLREAIASSSGSPAPSIGQWLTVLMISSLASATIAFSLKIRAGWSLQRCVTWGGVAWCVMPSATLIFLLLKRSGQPYSALV